VDALKVYPLTDFLLDKFQLKLYITSLTLNVGCKLGLGLQVFSIEASVLFMILLLCYVFFKIALFRPLQFYAMSFLLSVTGCF
jgi:hypothetical protein